ncbi:phage antirepressor KilAC domain-containing protein [Fusobacterium pseudoperiodonticum]|uniref:Oxidoreductase n=1 Tax=Fusobacterium pseudoperiodonticum TaxID=2663009 RepID=A0AAD0ANC2_9FUSO|nr:phage antirepressor KilAC domain-containing protein [Fusobacterium pseudoperiodonticum]ATV35416.1 oxidoreductase [Fusobacterium pseudoperiodonticum]ATV61690.1 oxidoreductase [Fusobacterium pseudoperiodonticum]
MGELIKIEVKDGQQLVSGRELHEFLEIKTPYTQWFERMCEYGFIENTDYILVSQKSESSNITGVKIVQDHLVTLNMAKEISMLQRNEKGKLARQYFIKCEEAWNSPEMILARANQIQSHMIEDYAKKIEVLENKVREDKPKVLFAESVTASKTSILVGDLAKIIKQNGIDIGQKRLFEWMRENAYLIKRQGSDYNMPTQKSMELELFEIKETAVTHSDGHISINKTPKVTGKGQVYFINKFLR